MKKNMFIGIVLIIINFATASMHTSIGGGLSLIVGEVVSDWYPGFNLEFLLFGKPVEYIGIGFGASYTRWGANLTSSVSEELRIAFHSWRVPVFLRGIFPVTEYFSIFTEYGNGVCIGMEKYYLKHGQNYKKSEVDFGLMAGGGVIVRNFEFKIMFNLVFIKYSDEDDDEDKYGYINKHLKWLSFNIGYHY